ncbi:hypothetical protein KIN20_008795 [Parelaphostrongylus tenuis]|uniref:Uncharacterized protein n=1 Tax=Parelaphostrongylus tenuis TaxID=148309 RepID=A0AAD5MNA0_PARTN|nr:hypothetical protein KIN20_008794 [Parelaphostrongylus tenuis]KAJ1352462.1 hypothetical protein KIN20_008795 [Parelaphostrongylus tenuis]
MELQAVRFRGVNFIQCPLSKEKTSALERTPISCWDITNIPCDSSWYVAVDGVVMENFTKSLQNFISMSGKQNGILPTGAQLEFFLLQASD